MQIFVSFSYKRLSSTMKVSNMPALQFGGVRKESWKVPDVPSGLQSHCVFICHRARRFRRLYQW
ncbi:hypothetical protein HETIRDRAFT_145420, partial [Heterobasidion irregulare TC 32-1]